MSPGTASGTGHRPCTLGSAERSPKHLGAGPSATAQRSAQQVHSRVRAPKSYKEALVTQTLRAAKSHVHPHGNVVTITVTVTTVTIGTSKGCIPSTEEQPNLQGPWEGTPSLKVLFPTCMQTPPPASKSQEDS